MVVLEARHFEHHEASGEMFPPDPCRYFIPMVTRHNNLDNKNGSQYAATNAVGINL